jgi:hypothetical protein
MNMQIMESSCEQIEVPFSQQSIGNYLDCSHPTATEQATAMFLAVG